MRIGYARVSTDDQTLDLQRTLARGIRGFDVERNPASGP